jgi:hypothetical protein
MGNACKFFSAEFLEYGMLHPYYCDTRLSTELMDSINTRQSVRLLVCRFAIPSVCVIEIDRSLSDFSLTAYRFELRQLKLPPIK